MDPALGSRVGGRLNERAKMTTEDTLPHVEKMYLKNVPKLEQIMLQWSTVAHNDPRPITSVSLVPAATSSVRKAKVAK